MPEPRPILKPAGNRVTFDNVPKHKNHNHVKTPPRPRNLPPQIPNAVTESNVSLDSTCSPDSCSSNSSPKTVNPATATASRRSVNRNGFKPVRVVPDAVDVATTVSPPPKRCEWITPHSGKRASPTHTRRRESSFSFSVLKSHHFCFFNK